MPDEEDSPDFEEEEPWLVLPEEEDSPDFSEEEPWLVFSVDSPDFAEEEPWLVFSVDSPDFPAEELWLVFSLISPDFPAEETGLVFSVIPPDFPAVVMWLSFSEEDSIDFPGEEASMTFPELRESVTTISSDNFPPREILASALSLLRELSPEGEDSEDFWTSRLEMALLPWKSVTPAWAMPLRRANTAKTL